MIVVGSSALVAIHLAESEAEEFSDLIAEDDAQRASTFTVFETRTVLSFRRGIAKLRKFDAWLRVARVVNVAFDEHQSVLAFDAYQRWGRAIIPPGSISATVPPMHVPTFGALSEGSGRSGRGGQAVDHLQGAGVDGLTSLFLLVELERRAVHAIALAGRARAVGEHVAEMAAALGALHLGADHAVGGVGGGPDRLLQWRPE